MSFLKNGSTQCNFFMLEVRPLKRNRFTQTVACKSKERDKPTARNTSTQCCIEIKTLVSKKNAGVQVQKEKRDQDCQTECADVGASSNQIKQFIRIIEEDLAFSCLSYNVVKSTRGEECLLICNNFNIGLLNEDVEPVKVVISNSGKCTISVPFQPVEVLNLVLSGTILKEDFCEVLHKISGKTYSLCPGIKCKADINTIVLPRGVSCFKIPFLRYQADACQVWYKGIENSKENQTILQCIPCKKAAASFSISNKRKSTESPNRKAKRLRADSKFNFYKLTPRSQKARLNCLKHAKICLKRKVQRLEKLVEQKDVLLVDEQSRQMESIVKIINENHKDELENVFQEHGEDKSLLKQIWSRDSYSKHCKDIEDFFEDQKFCKNGSKGNRWSSITLRIALSVYCRSPAAYEALKSFNILQLPSVESVQCAGRKLISEPGINHQYLFEQMEVYQSMKNEKEQLGEVVPKGEGILIFDEVKVIEKVIWNSKNHKFIGFSMNIDEYPLLNDIFDTTGSPKPTQYILQFLWRDMTSNFDLVGPYFTFSDSVESQPLVGTILETIKALEAYSFHTNALVCDGASENLACIKLTIGFKGAFKADMQNITPFFENPFREKGHNVHWIICPSHQMKSMISALHSANPSGTKHFKRNDVYFGWNDIENLKKREDIRVQNSQMRFVPKLLDSYIIRDSWTRLNVKPSKIMQQEDVLSELYRYSSSNEGTLQNRQSSFQCYRYLKACNGIFECGLLSNNKVKAHDSPILHSISQGFEYFSCWSKDELKCVPMTSNKNKKKQIFNTVTLQDQESKSSSGIGNHPVKDTKLQKTELKKQFLSWQTWDLLRICVFGFKGFCQDFLSQNPDHYICPIRINGSALESLFSQFKYSAGSKLSGANYSVARKAVLVKRNIHGKNSSNKDYRDVPLYIRESKVRP